MLGKISGYVTIAALSLIPWAAGVIGAQFDTTWGYVGTGGAVAFGTCLLTAMVAGWDE